MEIRRETFILLYKELIEIDKTIMSIKEDQRDELIDCASKLHEAIYVHSGLSIARIKALIEDFIMIYDQEQNKGKKLLILNDCKESLFFILKDFERQIEIIP